MKSIIHLFDRLGPRFYNRTHRYQLDENCSVAFRVHGLAAVKWPSRCSCAIGV